MSDIAIKVEGLSKLYRIGHRERYYALRDVLSRAITAPVTGIRQVSSSIFNRLSSILYYLRSLI